MGTKCIWKECLTLLDCVFVFIVNSNTSPSPPPRRFPWEAIPRFLEKSLKSYFGFLIWRIIILNLVKTFSFFLFSFVCFKFYFSYLSLYCTRNLFFYKLVLFCFVLCLVKTFSLSNQLLMILVRWISFATYFPRIFHLRQVSFVLFPGGALNCHNLLHLLWDGRWILIFAWAQCN